MTVEVGQVRRNQIERVTVRAALNPKGFFEVQQHLGANLRAMPMRFGRNTIERRWPIVEREAPAQNAGPAVQNFSPLAHIREALEASANNGQSRPADLARAALGGLTPLERALPVLMDAWHSYDHHYTKHEAAHWKFCKGCRALLEGSDAR